MAYTIDLSGKRALITGASSGFGWHFAQVLADAGAAVVVAARRTDRLTELVETIVAKGGDAKAITLDVTDAEAIKAAFEAAGALDIVVNNAGVGDARPLLDTTAEHYDSVVNTNLRGAFLVALEAGKTMQKQGRGGSIINIASILGLRVASFFGPYCISKAGVVHMTAQMAVELAPWKIRVNAIAPGYFITEMTDGYLTSEQGQQVIKRVPLKRLGEYEDLDAPLLMLASDAGRHITGVTIPVDGGHQLGGL